ncbi:hypothetical protein LJC19_04940 [Oxalobacter sp. OttesenSCG-928-P03]|nr:hypothetical protein [Oxalobacter sp. OttesenSCG-928-P03]
MKLTKTNRQAIIESVLKATTLEAEKEQLLAREREIVRRVFLESLPKDFVEKTKGLPKAWFATKSGIPIRNTVSVKAILDGAYEHGCTIVPFPDVEIFPVNDSSWAPPYDKYTSNLQGNAAEAAKLKVKRDNLINELSAFLNSCSNTKQVLEKMPELEPHLPKRKSAFAVVASTATLVSELKKSGFDTTVNNSKTEPETLPQAA